MEKTVCELFAGVGGFRLGLEKASSDWNTVWFSQWEPGKKKQWAHDCYTHHWPDIDGNTGIDIAQVDKTHIPDHNLLVGGFPCQDYSVARPLPGSHGLQGKKGVLWWQISEILQAKKAPFVLLENVDRLLRSPATQRGRDFGIMLTCFNKLGYQVEWRVVNAAEYGAAQRRRRIFIFAYRKDTKYAKKIEKQNEIDIISKKGFFAATFPIRPIVDGTDIRKLTVKPQDIWEISEKFQFDFGNGGYMRNGEITTLKVVPIVETPIPLKNIIEKDVADKYYLGTNLDKWKYLKGAKNIMRTSKTGHCYKYSEGPIAFPDPIDQPARTMLTSESSINRSTHIIEDPQTGKLRLLTPLEAERIQGFDDNWTNTGMPENNRYFCMGNALVVPMVTRMGKTLNKIFEAEK